MGLIGKIFLFLLSIQTRNYSSKEFTNQNNSLNELDKKLFKRPKHNKDYNNNQNYLLF